MGKNIFNSKNQQEEGIKIKLRKIILFFNT